MNDLTTCKVMLGMDIANVSYILLNQNHHILVNLMGKIALLHDRSILNPVWLDKLSVNMKFRQFLGMNLRKTYVIARFRASLRGPFRLNTVAVYKIIFPDTNKYCASQSIFLKSSSRTYPPLSECRHTMLVAS